MRYSNLNQVFVYDGILLSQITNGECRLSLGDVAAHPKAILRGYYVGTLEVSSTNSFDIGANCEITNVAGLDVKYTINRGFVIEQTNAIPWFGIYSTISAREEGLRTGWSTSVRQPSSIELNAPSDEEAVALSQIR